MTITAARPTITAIIDDHGCHHDDDHGCHHDDDHGCETDDDNHGCETDDDDHGCETDDDDHGCETEIDCATFGVCATSYEFDHGSEIDRHDDSNYDPYCDCFAPICETQVR